MGTLAVIMPKTFSIEEFKRKSYFINEYFKNRVENIIYYTDNTDTNALLLKNDTVSTCVRIFTPQVEKNDILVFYKSEIDKEYHFLYTKFAPGQHSKEDVYTLEIDGRIRASVSELGKKDYPHLDTHPFNKLGPKTPDGEFYYFPYGYLFKYPGLGSINPFGFRVPDNYSHLEEREKNHKLIIFFGGSAMWSMYSYIHEMFPSVLENKLNELCQSEEIDLRFTVLNFGMHGHIVLNEIMTYLLFCQNLKADYIIAHDGWNDLLYGMISDKFLLNEHNLAYQYNLEYWSQLLHQTKNVKPTQPTGQKFSVVNVPHNIISAYIERKKQFKNMVENEGSQFIWGLQPSIYSKRTHSSDEENYLNSELSHTNPFKEGYKRMPFIYKEYVDTIKKEQNINFFDVHEKFNRYDGQDTLFGDIIHTTPLGDKKIAIHYFEHFKKMILSHSPKNIEISQLVKT